MLPREPLENCMYAFTDLTDMVTTDSSVLGDVLLRCMMRQRQLLLLEQQVLLLWGALLLVR